MDCGQKLIAINYENTTLKNEQRFMYFMQIFGNLFLFFAKINDSWLFQKTASRLSYLKKWAPVFVLIYVMLYNIAVMMGILYLL